MSNDIHTLPIDPIGPLPPPLQIAIFALETIAQEATKAATTLSGPVSPVGPPGIPPSPLRPNLVTPPSTPVPAPTPPLSATSSSLLAVSDLIERRLDSDVALQNSLQALVSEAAVAQTRSSNIIPLLMKGGGIGTGGTGTGTGTGGSGSGTSGTSGTSGSAPPIPPIPVNTFWWGCHWYISEDGLKAISTGLALEGGVISVLIAALGAPPFPVNVFLAALAAYIAAEFALMKAVDKGKGVYVSMSWFAPGVFVPTSA